jgi:hypothetical protein
MRIFYFGKKCCLFIQKTLTASILCLAIIIPLIAQCNPAAAETFRFRYYGKDNNTVYFEDVIPVSSGGYLGVGKAFDVGGNDTEHDAIVTRFDQNGQPLWSRYYTFPGRYADDLRSVVETVDGNFIATGRVVLDGVNEHGNPSLTSAVLILKVDANGNLLWDKLIQNYANNSTYGTRIKSTIDNHFVIVGQAPAYQWNEQHSVYTYVATGALITKIDTDGNVIFSRTHYGDWTHSWHWYFNDVVQDSEGNYYTTGYAGTEAYSEGIGWGGMLLAKIDSKGDMVWAKKNDYAQDGEAVGVADSGQRILISGSTIYVAGVTYASHLSSFSLSGTRNWTKNYACIRNYDTGLSGASDFIHSGDGNFFAIMTGACQNIAKISPQGTILWSKYSPNNYNFRSLSLAGTGLIAGGWSLQDYTADNGDFYGAAAGSIDKFDSDGNTCEDLVDITLTVNDIEMLTNAVPFNVRSRTAIKGDIPDFSGPSLVVEKVCEDSGDDNFKLYYPHAASKGLWETEICAVNTSSESIKGSFQAYDDDGDPVADPIKATLEALSRTEMTVGDAFDDPSDIGYIIFESDSNNVTGYTKFYQDGLYRVAVPAVQETNTDEIYIPHIASNNLWWTGLALLNTTDAQKNLIITFSNGITKQINMAPGEHTSFTIKFLFGGVSQPDIQSAVISGGSGVIGLELFSKGSTLSGVLLKDDSAETLYFPHVASNASWWTGIVAYNPGANATMTVTPYSIDGSALNPIGVGIPAGEKYIGSAKNLSLPEGTAWFKIDSDQPLNGFELFGSNNGNILAGYSVVNINRQEGVFPKLDTDGWTGIAFVNTTDSKANITLSIYDNDGYKISEKSVALAGYEKIVDNPENIFGGSITAATYMKFSSDKDVVGFQLNGSSDGMMLDALPGM